MPLIVGGVGLGLAGVGSVVGGKAQQEAAQQQEQAAINQRDTAFRLAQPTARELEQLNQNNANYMDFLNYQRQDISAQSALLQNFLRQTQMAANGENPEILKPMQDQFNLERQQLASRLKATGGSGMAQSSAGLQQQAFQGLAQGQARLNAIGGLSNLASGAQAMRNQNVGLASEIGGSIFGQLGSLQTRQVNAYNSVPTYQYAGSGAVAQAALGAGLAGMGNNAVQLGALGYALNNKPKV